MAWNKQLDKTLTKKLIGLSHQIRPAVVVGHAGLSDAVIGQVRHVMQTHDLIKVRIDLEDRTEVQAAAEQLAQQSESTLVNRIGKIALLYKPAPEEPEGEKQPSRKPRTR